MLEKMLDSYFVPDTLEKWHTGLNWLNIIWPAFLTFQQCQIFRAKKIDDKQDNIYTAVSFICISQQHLTVRDSYKHYLIKFHLTCCVYVCICM